MNWLPKSTGIWRICWQATTENWAVSKFITQCNGKKPSLTIVQVVKNNKKYIFGGYATKAWGGNEHWISAPGSFLFSLRNNDNLPPFKSPLKNENDASEIYPCIFGHGPLFGRGYDLYIGNNARSIIVSKANIGVTYEAPPGYTQNKQKTQSLLAGSLYFTPSEVEVLYLD